ncbi:MAG: hypothetical protein IJK23_09645 [Clostridia bacterium]|nr:hypothetical protein [Clostridia bacterium]
MKKAALRVGDNKPDFAAILKIDGWRVDTMSAYLILFPELFEKKLIETFEVLPIFEPTPEICLYDDGTIAARFRLDGEPGDDFTGKYFHMCARIYMQGKPAAPAVLMDGFISDDANPDETIRLSHIGYRMEVRFVGGEIARLRTYAQRGMDVEQKALRFPGVITPGNIRYLGICAECARSFMFHSYNFPHMNEIPAYSDDGLDVCGVPVSIPDAQNWEGTIGGIRFSTHNAFRCPHCGAPYVDYQSHPEMMRYGTYACVHGGRKITEFQPDPLPDA